MKKAKILQKETQKYCETSSTQKDCLSGAFSQLEWLKLGSKAEADRAKSLVVDFFQEESVLSAFCVFLHLQLMPNSGHSPVVLVHPSFFVPSFCEEMFQENNVSIEPSRKARLKIQQNPKGFERNQKSTIFLYNNNSCPLIMINVNFSI